MSGPTSDPNWLSNTGANGNRNGNALPNPNPQRQPHAQSTPNISFNRVPSNTSNSSSILRNGSPQRAPPQSTGHIRIPTVLNRRPHLHENSRTLSEALRAVRSREEQETLLGDDEVSNPDGVSRDAEGAREPREVFTRDPHLKLPVYYTIQRIRRIVLASIDDPYTMEQLREPRMNVLIVKPLVDRLYNEDDVSIVYCLLVNRMQFLREQSFQHHHQTVNLTRANLCELAALKMLRKYDEDSTGRPGLLLLANILVAPFQPFQNAPPEVCPDRYRWEYQMKGGYEGKLTALEIAIVSESKLFLSSSACQKVIDSIYRGRIVYTPTAFMDILPDHYKHKPVSLYDPRKSGMLNQYRLIVPRTRNIIDVVQFMILLALYCLCMMRRGPNSNFTPSEAVFLVYAGGWVLDESASVLEHGWHVHTQNLWAFLDITFVVIYIFYIAIRLHAFLIDNVELGRQALDVLAIAAPILFPRLAFSLMPENMLFIALRAMVKEFTALSMIAVWCFGGFLLSLKWLSMGNSQIDAHHAPSSITTSKWMLWIWFGLDGTGIQQAPRYHEYLGPTLMITYAFLGNTLFLTVLVSILSNTFSKIAADATAEIQFRRTVLTFEGVKSDAIFAYRPPFNLLALFFLLPLKFALNPRWFHKTNVSLIRILNAPILLLIAFYERRNLWKPSKRKHAMGPSKRSTWRFWMWSGFSVHKDLQAVFEVEPPMDMVLRIEDEDVLENAILENSFAGGLAGSRSMSPGSGGVGGGLGVGQPRRRRLSTYISS